MYIIFKRIIKTERSKRLGQSVLCDTYLLFLVEFIGDNNEKKNPHPTDFTCRRKHRSANEDSICKLGYRGAICYLEPLLILRVLSNCREVRLLNMLKQFPPQPTSDRQFLLYDEKTLNKKIGNISKSTCIFHFASV